MSSDETLRTLLNADILLRLAGDVTYLRGLAYANEGHVEELAIQDGVLVAHVRGTETYTVRLDTEKPGLSFDCTCPVGDEVRFCKHCVAVGLKWLMDRGEPLTVTPRARPADVIMERVRLFLERQDAETLRTILLAEADANENLRDRLLLREAASRADMAAPRRLRAAIDRATSLPDYIPYHDVPSYAAVLEEMVDAIASFAQGNPVAAVELTEHAIWQVEAAIPAVDDSDGMVGDVLRRLQEIHFDACAEVRPDPIELARRLFDGEMRSGFDSFYGAVETYAEVLGEAGIAEFRRLARVEWDRLPALGPGEREARNGGHRWTTTRMMEMLASTSGDVEERVEVLSRDLSLPHAFLRIAEVYREKGEHDPAVEWARRGLDAFPSLTNEPLRVFLANEQHRRGEHEAAMELVWPVFQDRPFLAAYQLLKQHADRCGAWKRWRERALQRMHEHARQRTTGMIHLPGRTQDERSELVRVFLWEGDAEEAWRQAREGGCSPALWLQLAGLRKADHPEESLSVYREQVDRILIDTGERAYAEAIKLLPHVRELMERVTEDFAAYLTILRSTHKRRRKLLEMLDRFEQRATLQRVRGTSSRRTPSLPYFAWYPAATKPRAVCEAFRPVAAAYAHCESESAISGCGRAGAEDAAHSPAAESAKADFANFQRRLQSLPRADGYRIRFATASAAHPDTTILPPNGLSGIVRPLPPAHPVLPCSRRLHPPVPHPLMRTIPARGSLLLAFPALLAACSPNEQQLDDAAPAAEAASVSAQAADPADGWRPLFDGRTTSGWHAFGGGAPGAGWQVVDGALTRTGQAGDILTDEEFGSFELELEWKIAAAGNSGVFFHVVEDSTLQYVWQTGPEMQVLDNAGHADGRQPHTSAGSNFALHAPARDVTRPPGEWNAARLVVRGDHVEHWLNGEKLLEYELGDNEWRQRVAASKFAEMPRYGLARRGHIALQDHGDQVAFRNIRIRALP